MRNFDIQSALWSDFNLKYMLFLQFNLLSNMEAINFQDFLFWRRTQDNY